MRSLLTFAVLLLGIKVSAQKESIQEIQVKEVTVFLQGAKVFGHTNVNLQKGKNLIKVVNLPNDLDENTYKVNLEKTTTLLSITPQTNHLKHTQSSVAEESLIKEKKELERKVNLLDIQIKNIRGEQDLINNNLKIVPNDKSAPQDQLIKLSAFYSTRMLELDNQLFELNEQKATLAASVFKLEKQLQESQTFKSSNLKELILEILAEREMNLNLGLSYIVNNAGWSPKYDLRAASVKHPLEIIYKGQLYQRTGQDWKDVKLYVSTYRPSYNQDRPILHPMYITEYANYNAMADYSTKKLSVEMTNSYQMRVEENEAPSPIPPSTITDNQLNVVYELKYTQTIYSQEKEQYVVLDRKETPATYKYHAVPKINTHAFLLALVPNWQQLNLVSGEANIFFEDNYVGKTMIQSNYVKDEFPISLGVDERIVIKRTKMEDKTTTKTMNSNKWQNEMYQISIRNNTKESIALEILDQVPISQNSKISVKKLNIEDGDYDENTGSILWNRNIGSGASNTISFSYEIKYPKDMQISYAHR